MLTADYLTEASTATDDEITDLDLIILGIILANMRIALNVKNYEVFKKIAIKNVYKQTIIQVNKKRRKIKEVVNETFLEAANENFKIEDETMQAAKKKPKPIKKNKKIQDTINKGAEKTANTIANYTKTTAVSAQDIFKQKLDEAYIKLMNPAADFDKVLFETLKDLASKGVTTVQYPQPSGKIRIDQADVAARRALLTGLNQTYAEANLEYAEQMGENLVQVSQHHGAREGEGISNHKGWQGKIYSIKGSTEKYPNLRTKTGYEQGAGLCGWNCRHSFRVYIEGVSEKLTPLVDKPNVFYDGKEYTYYEATQRQRYMERQIRKHKREYWLAKETNQPANKINDKINYWQNEIDKFTKAAGLDRRPSSERVVSRIR
jgi:hypothetical protein